MKSPDVPYTEQVLAVAGTRIHYIEAGPGRSTGANADAPPDTVVLIHGSLCDYRYWRWQINDLSRDFHVIAPSLPGCWPEPLSAESDPSPYNLARHSQAIVELCESLSPSRNVHLVGHSRGAHVAVEAALARPAQCATVTLADPGFPFTDEPATTPVHAKIAARLGTAPLDEVLQEFVDAVNGAGTWKRTVRWFKEMTRANAWTLPAQVSDIGQATDLRKVETLANRPMLLVSGELSPPRYIDRIARLQELLPHARHVTVPRAAHGMNLANAPFFNEMLRTFVGSYLVGSLPATPST